MENFRLLIARIGVLFGHTDSQAYLGTHYVESANTIKQSKGLALLELSANKRNTSAQYNLGFMYFVGDYGVEQNLEISAHWFLMAAQNENKDAQHFIACCYEQGNGVSKDLEEAHYWWEKAAWAGVAESQSALASNYKDGLGVEKDIRKSYMWYLISKKFNTTNSTDYSSSIIDELSAYDLSEVANLADEIEKKIRKNIG